MPEPSPARSCPRCGAKLAPDAESCAACGRNNANPFKSPAAPASDPTPRGFNLQLLFTVVTVICVSLAIGILLPGLGVFFAIVFVPAVIRAAAAIKRRQETGPLKDPTIQMVTALFASAGVTFAVWMASAVAFVAVCTPTTLAAGFLFSQMNLGGNVGLVVVCGFSGLAGLATFVWLMRKFWPRPAEDEHGTA